MVVAMVRRAITIVIVVVIRAISSRAISSRAISISPISSRADSTVAAVKSSSSSCNKHYCSLEIFYDLGTGLSCFYTIQFSSVQSLRCV